MNGERKTIRPASPVVLVRGIPPGVCPTCWDDGTVIVPVRFEPARPDKRLTWERIKCPNCQGQAGPGTKVDITA